MRAGGDAGRSLANKYAKRDIVGLGCFGAFHLAQPDRYATRARPKRHSIGCIRAGSARRFDQARYHVGQPGRVRHVVHEKIPLFLQLDRCATSIAGRRPMQWQAGTSLCAPHLENRTS
jgi:hypothetical protein